MIAICVGYCFNVVDEKLVRDIELRKSEKTVVFQGKDYDLYFASTYQGSRLIDVILDELGDYRIEKYLKNKSK